MARKKAPNWEDIKTRYVVHGEKPSDIAKDYDVISQTISNRASEEKWGDERLELGKKLRDSEANRRKRILEKTGRIIEKMLHNINTELPSMGATVQDGEGFPNKYHSDAWKELVKAYVKPDEDETVAASKMPEININFVSKNDNPNPDP